MTEIGPALEGASPPPGRDKQSSFWRELPILLVVALGLALLIKAFLVQAFYIPSGSMENTLRVNDRVLVNKLVYDFRDVRRGEVIVFDASNNLAKDGAEQRDILAGNGVRAKAQQFLGFGAPGENDYIKRVIGIPGDRVGCCDNQGRVTVQPAGGEPVPLEEESYLFGGDVPSGEPFCEAGEGISLCPIGAPGFLVPEGRYWVMGDHRSASKDSRPTRETVPEDRIVGRAFAKIFPVQHIGGLGVPDTFDQPAIDSLGAVGSGVGSLAVGPTPYALGAVAVLPLGALRLRRRNRYVPRH